MTGGSQGSFLQSIQTLFSVGSVGGMTDSQLLERFLSRRDEGAEAAFAALVSLHGPMVWDVCRNILSDPHAAEDAFQATFLILVRKAGSIRQRDAIGSWLHGVARRVAVRAKATAARRLRHERQGTAMKAILAPDPARREQLEALHEEVDRLTEKYRAPVVLCYLEGRTHSQAARLLKCPVGTVSIRLSRARERLRARLTRRGMVLPAAWTGATLRSESSSAAIPLGLAESTTKAAMDFVASKILMAGAVPISAALLAKGAIRTMTLTRLIATVTSALAVAFVTASVGLLAAGKPPTQVNPGQKLVVDVKPVVNVKSVAAAPVQAGGHDHDAKPGAVRKDDRPLLKFFEIRDRAQSVVYAIDCSGSMATRNSLDVAKRELMASLNQLPPDVQFAVIFYNLNARILTEDQGHEGLIAATAANRKQVQSQIAKVTPDGGTNLMSALRTALALKPEVIFFLTDADLMTNGDVDEILAEMGKTRSQNVGADRNVGAVLRGFMANLRRPSGAQKTRIQVIEFGRGREVDQRTPLRRLATTTGGSYLYLDVTQFPR